MKNETEPTFSLEAVPASVELSPATLLRDAIKGGLTADNAEAIATLAKLYEHMEEKRAERDFAAAFVRMQAELPTIVAKTVIPNRGKYERFEDVMAAIQPALRAHGFSVAFSMDFKEGRVIETCHLSHAAGITRSNSFAVRTGKADTDTQADCKAATTAKRNALLNALNIVIRQDVLSGEEGEDASLEGAFIGADRVQYLKEKLAETGGNVESFLRMAGAETFEQICNGSYDVLVRALNMKKRA